MRIELFRDSQSWHAAHIAETALDEAELGLMRSLFNGTTTLPTAYTAHAPAQEVRARIAELNPGYTVTVRKERDR